MERVITSEDLGRIYPCPEVDVNPYCQITRRGYNMSCERCRAGDRTGFPYWHRFLLEDNERR